MLTQHLVRVGLVGQIGRFNTAENIAYPRGKRVICRTQRGLELGEVLSSTEALPSLQSDGVLLRCVTVEDELLLARLDKKKNEAYTACSNLLQAHGSSAVLMDVEHLFDGRSLYFYFLGHVPPELESLTAELAATYDAAIAFQQFAETLTQGCGPGCGTAEATGSGCGTGGCSTCSVASACKK